MGGGRIRIYESTMTYKCSRMETTTIQINIQQHCVRRASSLENALVYVCALPSILQTRANGLATVHPDAHRGKGLSVCRSVGRKGKPQTKSMDMGTCPPRIVKADRRVLEDYVPLGTPLSTSRVVGRRMYLLLMVTLLAWLFTGKPQGNQPFWGAPQ